MSCLHMLGSSKSDGTQEPLEDGLGFKGYLDTSGKVGAAVIKRQMLYVAGGGCLQQSSYA